MNHGGCCQRFRKKGKMEAGEQDTKSRPSLESCWAAPPSVGRPGKAPNTQHTLDSDENIFSEICCSHRKVHPRNHPRKRVGAASLGLPIAPPTARKVFVQRAKWRQLEVQGWVEPILSSAVCSGSYLLGHHAGTVAAVYTTAPASASVGGGWGQTWLPLV